MAATSSAVLLCTALRTLPRNIRPLLQPSGATLVHQHHLHFGSPVCILQGQNLVTKVSSTTITGTRSVASSKEVVREAPTKEASTPTAKAATPTPPKQGAPTPAKDARTPAKDASTPAKDAGTPAKDAGTPGKATTAAATGTTSADDKPCAGSGSAQADIDAAIVENLKQMREQNFEKMTHPEELKHFRASKKPPAPLKFTDPAMVVSEPEIGTDALPHPIWSEEEVHGIQITHKVPKGIIDHVAYYSVQGLRSGYDLVSGYNKKPRDEKLWLIRVCYLETVAGCPGMVAAMTRHLLSLRRMRRDHGWIHTLLEEAENERMHLMTALQLKQPSWLFRMSVMATQGVFVPLWFVAYMISPKYCHRFVGYLEEEAVVTYTKLLGDIENGEMQHWKTQPAPPVAKTYWSLSPDATMKDVILAIRADEAHHRVVNHTLGSMKADDYNPYKPGH